MPEYSAIQDADGDQTLAVSNSAVQLTLPAWFSSSGVSAGRVRIQVRTAAVLFAFHTGSLAAADESTGTKLNVGDALVLNTLSEMRNLNLIRATGTDGAIFAIYERRLA